MNKWLIILLSLLCIDASAQQALYSKKLVLSERNFADSIGIQWERNQVYIPVQINGKLRAVVSVPRTSTEDEVKALVKQDAQIAAAIAGKNIVKEIYVPKKICNLIVK